MKTGEKIRHLRTQAGMKQGELANRLKVTVSYLSQIERGRRPGVAFIRRFSRHFDIPTGYFFLDPNEKWKGTREDAQTWKTIHRLMNDLFSRRVQTVAKSRRP